MSKATDFGINFHRRSDAKLTILVVMLKPSIQINSEYHNFNLRFFKHLSPSSLGAK